ncbi:MAG: lipopolysaccharide kinase InaA family protein [Carboxylicivirga sp.]|nr:lipopolysaccharide kinase InaA family protein [Carboxylicivirga sp.]
MKKVVLLKDHSELGDFVEDVAYNFENGGYSIKEARNKIKKFTVEGQNLCIKSFGKLTVFNRWMYSYFRKSKARRSFEYAQKLTGYGIDTPEPIAYVEIYNGWHFLLNSYYICRYESFDYSLSEVLAGDVEDKQLIIRGFVNLVANGLHPNGVYHKDFNGSNVLVQKTGYKRYRYQLVDLNRIAFKQSINKHKALQNMQQISANPSYLTELARHYASLKNIDEDDTIYELILVKALKRFKRRYTKRLLHTLKTLF